MTDANRCLNDEAKTVVLVDLNGPIAGEVALYVGVGVSQLFVLGVRRIHTNEWGNFPRYTCLPAAACPVVHYLKAGYLGHPLSSHETAQRPDAIVAVQETVT